jgi:pimeloyl-ACP methyl ester carboxylesterase
MYGITATRMKSEMPMVLIGGILCDAGLWEEQFKYFSQSTKVFVLSSYECNSIAGIARKITEIHARFNLVGFSSGGFVAQEIATKYPNSVNKLILLNTSGGLFAKRQQVNRKALLNLCEENGIQIGIDNFTRKLLSTYDEHDEINARVLAMIERIQKNDFLSQMKSVINYMDCIANLKDITCPTLVLGATDDPFMGEASYRELLNEIPAAQLKLLDKGGHMLPFSKSEEMNSIIETFFGYPVMGYQQSLRSMSYV